MVASTCSLRVWFVVTCPSSRTSRRSPSCSPSKSRFPKSKSCRSSSPTGPEKGFLTYDEIVTGLEDVELTKEQVEDFYTYLIDHNIELVEGEQHKTPPHEQPQPRGREAPAAPKLDLTVEPSLDSLRLYLREIGKVPLLTADQEV